MQILLFLLIGIFLFSYFLSKRIGKWLLPRSEYKGNYVQQSIGSAITIIIIVIIFFTLVHEMTYNNCALSWGMGQCYTYYDYYMIHLDISWYKFILWPSVIIIFVTEFFIRTIVKRNNVIYPILNTIFLSALPLFIAYFIDNLRLM